jgi:hypothetical protein
MHELLVILDANDPEAERKAQQPVEAAGGHVAQRYGRHVWIVEDAPELAEWRRKRSGIVRVYKGRVPDKMLKRLDETAQIGVAAWNERHSPSYRAAKRERKGEGLPWDHPDFEREG